MIDVTIESVRFEKGFSIHEESGRESVEEMCGSWAQLQKHVLYSVYSVQVLQYSSTRYSNGISATVDRSNISKGSATLPNVERQGSQIRGDCNRGREASRRDAMMPSLKRTK